MKNIKNGLEQTANKRNVAPNANDKPLRLRIRRLESGDLLLM